MVLFYYDYLNRHTDSKGHEPIREGLPSCRTATWDDEDDRLTNETEYDCTYEMPKSYVTYRKSRHISDE
jgi:hypothetical protein